VRQNRTTHIRFDARVFSVTWASQHFRSIRVFATTLIVCAVLWAVAPLVAQTRRPYAAIHYGGNYLHNYLIPPAPASTPWAPAWSPDGTQIAVGWRGSIWTIELASGTARELTAGPTYHSSPGWSPDGRWIVYTADNGGRAIHLEAVDVATKESHALISDDVATIDPRFSPDGTKLAYVSSEPNGFLNVFVRPFANGAWNGDPVAITEDSNTRSGSERPYFTDQDMAITPAWTPDGAALVFLSNHGVPLGSGHIVRAPAVARGIAQAEPIVREQTLYHARPDVSPDGQWLVFVSSHEGRDRFHNLDLLSLRSGERRTLTHFEHDAFYPRWSPDGRRIAFLSNRDGLPALHVFDVAAGTDTAVIVSKSEWRRPMGRLEVRVVDARRGDRTPARVHLTAADGRFYAPPVQLARVSWAGDHIFHTDGVFALDLPAGTVMLDIVKGFEFQPVHQELQVAADRTTTADIVLKRLDGADEIAARGWCGGSTGAHMHPGGLQRDDLDALLAMGAAEDVHVIGNPLAYRPHNVTPQELFVPGGAPHVLSRPGVALTLGQEYRPPFLGHIMLFGPRQFLDQLVPMTIGYEPPAAGDLAPSTTTVLRDAQRAGAITGYVHAFGGEMDPLTSGLGLGKGFMVDAALGTVDTLEWAAAGRAGFFPWYAALNNRLRVNVIGGEDTISNLAISRLVGSVRTYVRADAGCSAASWWDGIKKGHTFVTTGPLIDLRVGEGERQSSPGDTVQLPASGGDIDVTVNVTSITPLQKAVLVQNGTIIADIPLDADRRHARWRQRVPVSRSGWLHVRAEGLPADRFPLDAIYAQALTNPVWTIVGDQPVRDRASAEYGIKWINMLRLMADAWPGWTNAEAKRQLFAEFDEALAVYERLAREAPSPAEPSK
jgi:TolB protein